LRSAALRKRSRRQGRQRRPTMASREMQLVSCGAAGAAYCGGIIGGGRWTPRGQAGLWTQGRLVDRRANLASG
jgi:hypothetical protein